MSSHVPTRACPKPYNATPRLVDDLGLALRKAVASYMEGCVVDGDCLVRLTAQRYGEVHYAGKRMSAHRAVYTALKGAVPPGLMVRHTCDRKNCVRPDHLIVGTGAQNERDKRRQGAAASKNAGTANAHAVISEADVIRLRQAARAGRTLRTIAEEFGLGYTLVRNAVRGVTWTHVTEPPVPSKYTWQAINSRRVSPEVRAEAIRLANGGVTLSEIAERLNICRLTAFRITQPLEESA